MSRSRGDAAEDLAAAYLQAQGLRLVTRNYQCRQGEIDLVMLEGEQLLFVEVRYRRGHGFGDAAASVDGRKQGRVRLAAEHFLQRHPEHRRRPCRFDVLAMDGPQMQNMNWIPNAFGMD